MNRNQEYEALLQELEATPAALDGTAKRALRRRRRERRLRIFGVPAGSLAACFVAFVLLVNLFPPFARACGNVPLLRALAQAVAWSPVPLRRSGKRLRPAHRPVPDGKRHHRHDRVCDRGPEAGEYLLHPGGEGVRDPLRRDCRNFPRSSTAPCMGADFRQKPGTLLHFTLDYQDNDVPEGFTMTLGVTGETAGEAESQPPAASSVWDALEKDTAPPEQQTFWPPFTFDLKFDPTYTASGEIIPVNSAFQLDGQTLTVTEAEVYPTHVRVNVEGAAANTAWLKSLDFYLENEDGERFEPISNGVTATGDPDTPAMNSFRLESPYFADSAHLTLHITGATWLDKDMERIRVDLKSGTADQMPEGVELYSAERSGDGWRIDVPGQRPGGKPLPPAVLFHRITLPTGRNTTSRPPQSRHRRTDTSTGRLVLRDYPWDEVWLCARLLPHHNGGDAGHHPHQVGDSNSNARASA